MHAIERDVFFDSIGTDDPRSLRSQAEQALDRAAGLASGAQLQHLSEQNQTHDHRRWFEIQRDFDSTVNAHLRRENSRSHRRNEAVSIGRPRTRADQREHVGTTIHDRIPKAVEDRPSGPQYDNRREYEFDPRRVDAGEHHPEQHGRWRNAEPEAAQHVLIFRIDFVHRVQRDADRLQRHSALGARARADLAYLGMHRACVFDARHLRRGRRGLRVQILFGVGLKLSRAALRAEVIGLALVQRRPRGLRRIHGHTANGIARLSGLKNRKHRCYC